MKDTKTIDGLTFETFAKLEQGRLEECAFLEQVYADIDDPNVKECVKNHIADLRALAFVQGWHDALGIEVLKMRQAATESLGKMIEAVRKNAEKKAEAHQ